MKVKIIIKILFFSIFALFLSAIISNYQIKYNSLFRFISFFYLSVFFVKTYGENKLEMKILFILICSYCLLAVFAILDFISGNLWSFPMFILGLIGIVSGYTYVRWKKPLNLLPFVLGSLLAIFMLFQGWEYWIHRSNFGTFTGKISAYKLNQNIDGIDEKDTHITSKLFEKKIVLLDFWNTSCGICFEKFPQLQQFYNKYRNEDSIIVFAINKPIEEDAESNPFKVIEEKGFSFPVLLPTDENLPEKFGVKGYPTTVVINKQGNVIYKGSIEGAIILVEELMKQEN